MNRDRVLNRFIESIAELIDAILTDEDKDETYDKNPYTEDQVRFALNRCLNFHATKRVIESFEYKSIVSTPDKLEVSFTFVYRGKLLGFDMYTKF